MIGAIGRMAGNGKMMNIRKIAMLLSTVAATAFDNQPGWKMDGDKIALNDAGNPIYIDSAGNETTVDGGTISRLNGEAKSNRERAEKAEGSLKAFEGLDPAAAKKALDTVAKIDAKTLIDAGEVDRVRAEISKGYEAQIAELSGKVSDGDAKIAKMHLDTAFLGSKFVTDNIAVPPEMFKATFANHFKVEGDEIKSFDAKGNPIYSKKRMGEPADFDEALSILVEQYPNKDQILKPATPGGGFGGGGGGGGSRGTGRSIKRADFDAMSPMAKAEAAGLAGKGELLIVD